MQGLDGLAGEVDALLLQQIGQHLGPVTLTLHLDHLVVLLDGPAIDYLCLGAGQREIRPGQNGLYLLLAAQAGHARVGGALELVIVLIAIEGEFQIPSQQMGGSGPGGSRTAKSAPRCDRPGGPGSG